MTALTTTDAIVMKTMKYRDTSTIATFYTRSFGKVRGIAKGARDIKNRFGAGLQPLGRVTLVFYRKEDRDLHLVSQSDLRVSARKMRNDLRLTAVGLACLELLDQVTHDAEQNEPLFSLIDEVVGRVDETAGDPELLLFAFKIRLAGLMGFTPDVSVCASCGASVPGEAEERLWFDIARGSVFCRKCRGDSSGGRPEDPRSGVATVRLTASAVRALQVLQGAEWPTVEAMGSPEPLRNEIREVLRSYLRYHIESLKPLRSESLLTNE